MALIPLMLLSDAPSSSTGLGRITRELAKHIKENLSETFELATYGYAGCESRHFPWRQYTVRRIEDWVLPELPVVWNDFAGDRKGILLSIWNPGWLPWLAQPEHALPNSSLKSFLMSKPFEKWIYAPIDAEGPGGLLPEKATQVLMGFDRVLAYTRWSAKMIDRSFAHMKIDRPATPNLPHGIDTSVFYPRNRVEARNRFVENVRQRQAKAPLKEDVFLVGMVATNSARKDFGLGLETCAELLKMGKNVGVWVHTDQLVKHWNLIDMANAFGLADRIVFTTGFLDDDSMAEAYSACDVTLAIGSGEGWGYPITESLACCTPVVHGNYAGGAEIMSPWKPGMLPYGLAEVEGWRWDGIYCNRRPVFNGEQWAVEAIAAAEEAKDTKLLNPRYEWKNCWKEWERWLLQGVNG